MRITERTDREQHYSLNRSFISKKKCFLPLKKEQQQRRFYIYN